ncbi:MAG TPA: hypothetical protein VNO56_00440, partial [Gaiellaceae bacterium]|nr:hypothetical protein [Gaiellaceae bacterium]
MATAILVDATIVRMVLAPALMELMGAGELVTSVVARSRPSASERTGRSEEGVGRGVAVTAVRGRSGDNGAMRVSAKVDYALRAAVQLAAAGEGPTKGERIAEAQGI